MMTRVARVSIAAWVAAAALLFGGCMSHAPARPVQLVPADLHWQSNPKLHALQTTTLLGDPTKAGAYVQRIKLPPNMRLAPHLHPNQARTVTVLSGTFYFGYGPTFDESKLKTLPPGSFFTEPASMPHFARTGDEEVVLELHAIGPDGTAYIAGDAR